MEDLNTDTKEVQQQSCPLPKIYLKGLVRMVGQMREAFITNSFGEGRDEAGQRWGNDPASVAATFEQVEIAFLYFKSFYCYVFPRVCTSKR